jgi:hypothetical protein
LAASCLSTTLSVAAACAASQKTPPAKLPKGPPVAAPAVTTGTAGAAASGDSVPNAARACAAAFPAAATGQQRPRLAAGPRRDRSAARKSAAVQSFTRSVLPALATQGTGG